MAWPKKPVSMSIKDGPKGLMSTTKLPMASITMPHPTVAHLQEHVGKMFGAPKPAKASPLRAGTPGAATNSGGGKVAPSPGQAKIAASMLGGS